MTSTASKRAPKVSEQDLILEISALIADITGVQLGERQRSMVQSRLRRRMIELRIASVDAYWTHLESHRDEETRALVSLLTTHHTYFFREFAHFEFLEKTALLAVAKAVRARGDSVIRIWSAACSRGQEVYSLAMHLKVHLPQIAPDLKFEIVGSDVDPESVAIGKNGVYRWDELKEVPSLYLGQEWVRGTGEIAHFAKAKAGLKDHCKWLELNLFNLAPLKGQKFDLIFCRNVFIYFTPEQIKAISQNLNSQLYPDGFLFVGLSESINGLGLKLEHCGPSVYRLPSVLAPKLTAAPTAKLAPIRILCVDDSPTVLTLLKKVFTGDSGFEIAGTAKNGLEAAEFLKTHTVDAMTLDIHMPEMSGVQYLEKHFKRGHPPVVMISSVSREDSELGIRSLELGATDYVEKPTMQNLQERSDEIRTKLRVAVAGHQMSGHDLSRSFEDSGAPMPATDFIRIIVGTLGDRKRVQTCLEEFSGHQPPTFLLFYGSESLVESGRTGVEPAGWKRKDLGATPITLSESELWIGDFQRSFKKVMSAGASKRIQLWVCSELPAPVLASLIEHEYQHVMVNDAAPKTFSQISGKSKCAESVPMTSFSYHSLKGLRS